MYNVLTITDMSMVMINVLTTQEFEVGTRLCRACGFEWVGTLPLGADRAWQPSIECISCGERAGRLKDR